MLLNLFSSLLGSFLELFGSALLLQIAADALHFLHLKPFKLEYSLFRYVHHRNLEKSEKEGPCFC